MVLLLFPHNTDITLKVIPVSLNRCFLFVALIDLALSYLGGFNFCPVSAFYDR